MDGECMHLSMVRQKVFIARVSRAHVRTITEYEKPSGGNYGRR